MELAQRLNGYNTICGIEIDLAGIAVPSAVDYVERFYGSIIHQQDARAVYYGSSSVRFRESEQLNGGTRYYEQELSLQFPNHDAFTIARMNEFKRAKYVYITNSHGQQLVLGRNDHKQNRRPRITCTRDQQFTYVLVYTESLTPTGFSGEYANSADANVPLFLFN